jgi:hypothetical protein
MSLLGQPRHDYRPSTQIFVDLSTDRIADELQIVQRGTERGAMDRPPAESQTLDDVEHLIVERIEAHKQDAHGIYLEHLHTYGDRLIALNFEERFSVIQQAAPEAVGDFVAEAALGRDQLFALRRRLYESEVERDHFRARHAIARPARLVTPGKMLLKVGLLAILFVVEVTINGSFLAASNLGGLLGGAVQAVSFAALNIVASFLWGLFPIRLINRRNILVKFLGLISLLAYLAFAVVLNLTLSHLREIPPTLGGNVGHEVLVQMLTTPHILHDVNSWVFFGVGFVFSLIAVADGLMFFDPYIGYAGLERRWIEASRHYTEQKAALIEDLREIRDDATEVMNEAARDLATRRNELDALLAARGRLSQRFVEHQNHIERSCRALLAIYREANQKSRSTPAPEHFARPYVMARIGPAVSDTESADRAELVASIEETRKLLQGEIRAIHETFENAVRSYREIDDMIPERKISERRGG